MCFTFFVFFCALVAGTFSLGSFLFVTVLLALVFFLWQGQEEVVEEEAHSVLVSYGETNQPL